MSPACWPWAPRVAMRNSSFWEDSVRVGRASHPLCCVETKCCTAKPDCLHLVQRTHRLIVFGQCPRLKRITRKAPTCWPRTLRATMHGSRIREDSIRVGRALHPLSLAPNLVSESLVHRTYVSLPFGVGVVSSQTGGSAQRAYHLSANSNWVWQTGKLTTSLTTAW